MSGHGIKFNLNSKLHLKDPQMTEYGQKLISHSILLFDELGFEKFTFKKLSKKIESTETSIYRYFKNKHKLLLWLTCWYWEWVYYLIDINIKNIEDPKKRLQITIHNIVNASSESPLTTYINENILHKVVINESSKAYHVYNVDDENQHGSFESYVHVVNKVAEIIKLYKHDYPYTKVLASNLFEMPNSQIFFAEHLPALTDIKDGLHKYDELETVLCNMTFKLLS